MLDGAGLGPLSPGKVVVCYNISSDAGWSSLVARRAHNPKVAGSNPAPATSCGQTWLGRGAIVPISFQFVSELRSRDVRQRTSAALVQAERELRKQIDHDPVLATAERKTLADAGALYIDHLEQVMDRKRSTIQDYRGYLRGHFEGFFSDTPIDRIDPARVASCLKRKRADNLSSKTVQNHLKFASPKSHEGRSVPMAGRLARELELHHESPTREQAR